MHLPWDVSGETEHKGETGEEDLVLCSGLPVLDGFRAGDAVLEAVGTDAPKTTVEVW